MRKVLAVLALSTAFVGNSFAQQEAKIFTEYKADPKRSILPDFSYVGYKNGEKLMNYKASGFPTYDITAFGAVANDDKSDKDAIIDAITAANKTGGGIIYFPKGRFIIQDIYDDLNSIWVSNSNVVFKGSGSGKDGTELFMKVPLQPQDTTKMWSSPPMFVFGSKSGEKNIGKISAHAKVGDFDIQLDQTTDLTKGDWVILTMRSKDEASIKLDLGDYPVNPDWKALANGGVDLSVVHQIAKIKGNTITLGQPLAYPINADLDWKVAKYSQIEEVGIEDIAFVGNWKTPFVHHRSWLHDSGYTMINMRRITNSWINNCRFTDVSVGAVVNNGANITISNCEITGNGGHEAITNGGGTNVLLSNITDKASQWHSVGSSKTAMNTVLYKVTYPATTCFESHASQPRNTLLDNVTGGLMMNRGGGDIVNMPNHMRNLVFWNYTKTNTEYPEFNFWPNQRYWKIPYPIMVGFNGTSTKFIESQLKYEESNGQKVLPQSLYEGQLKNRLGKLPSWFK
ncbi:DUF4955 domain-containing protein [Pedobacter arcticus]|uniref:DUF4955 domain-containing protein n=1 Tax=Pedobacter arcticus TaxID=752140 RepID=UPI0002EEAE1D|nr:DUF4955 domain-containing protein [Pedobacter arcticus]